MPTRRRQSDPDEHDPELDSYLAALAAPPAEPVGGPGPAQVLRLRVPTPRIEQLRRVAEERGVSPAALAVEWVVEQLDREDAPTGPLSVVAGVESDTSPLPRLRRP